MANPESGFQTNEVAQEQTGDLLESLKNDLIAKIEDPQLESIAIQKANKLDKNSEGFAEQSKDLLKAFKNIEKSILGVDKPGKELFISFLETSINADMLLQILANNRGRKLKNYTKKNGYVINDETLDFFNKSLGSDKFSIKKIEEKVQENSVDIVDKTEIVGEKTEIVEEKTEIVEEKVIEERKKETIKNSQIERRNINLEKAKNISELYKNGLPESKLEGLNCKKIISDLRKIDVIKDPEKVIAKQKELLSLFSSTKEGRKEFKIYLSLLQDHNQEQYQNFVNYVKSENIQVLTDVIHEFDPKQEVIVTPIENITKAAIQEAAVGRHKEKEGQEVEFDMSEVPPIRKFNVEGGNYVFESELGISVFYEAMVKYEEAKQDVERVDGQLKEEKKSLQTKIEGNKSDIEDKKNMIDSLESEGIPTDDLERELQLLIDNTKTLEDELVQKEEEIINNNNVLKELKLEYAMDLDKLISVYEKQLEAEDLKKKEIGQFMNDIGLDIIPADMINQIIEEYKSNVFDVKGFHLEQETIDLENGTFGESGTEEDGDMWKRNMVRFMNKILFNDPFPSDNTLLQEDNFITTKGTRPDRTELEKALHDSGVKTAIGFNKELITKNLSAEVEITEK